MNKLLVFSLVMLLACNSDQQQVATADTLQDDTTSIANTDFLPDTTSLNDAGTPSEKHRYSNESFKNVVVKKTNPHTWVVQGKARVFEARFSWIVKSSGTEILNGSESTSEGAPAWGKFHFKIKDIPPSDTSSLELLLFEASAKDGSPQHQLSVPLK